MVNHRIRNGALVLGVVATVFTADRVMAVLGPPPVFPPPGGGGGNQCYFIKCCPDGSGGFNCIPAYGGTCSTNEHCTGGGTCVNGTPTNVWADCVANS